MKINFKFHHVAISCQSIPDTLEFYKNILDFEDYKDYRSDDMKIYLLKKENMILEIFYFKNHMQLPDYRKEIFSDISTIGVSHFAFEVESLEETIIFLENNNITLYKGITQGKNLKYFFIKDPSGILVEFVEKQLNIKK